MLEKIMKNLDFMFLDSDQYVVDWQLEKNHSSAKEELMSEE